MRLSQGAVCGHRSVPRPAGTETIEQGLGPFRYMLFERTRLDIRSPFALSAAECTRVPAYPFRFASM